MASSSSIRPSTPSNLAQVHSYRHLAPPYAAVGSDAASMPPPSTAAKSATGSRTALKPFSAQEMRQLVLDYLTHEGYVDSATAFAHEMVVDWSAQGGEDAPPANEAARDAAETQDSSVEAMQGVEATPEPTEGIVAHAPMSTNGLPHTNGTGKNVAFADSDAHPATGRGIVLPEAHGGPSALSRDELRDLRLRKEIRDAVAAGRITQAVEMLNEHYPAVLAPASSSAPSPAVSAKSAFARPLAAARSSSICTPQAFFVAPNPTSQSVTPPASSSFFQPASAIPVTGARFGSWALSLSPETVALNLQTQTFIELMRTAHATSAMSAPSTPTSSVHGGVASNGSGDAHSDAEMSASTSSLGGSASILNIAITQSQALREKVLQLPPGKDREGWEKECIDVCGLLAYKDLATCPVRGYLAQSRRDILAEMVNSAILQHTGRTPMSLISLAARQATAMWDTLREMNHPFPPPEAITIGRDRDSNNGKNKPPRTYPVFDLHTFLHERDTPSTSSTAMEP